MEKIVHIARIYAIMYYKLYKKEMGGNLMLQFEMNESTPAKIP